MNTPKSADDFTKEERDRLREIYREPGSYVMEHCPGCGKKWYVDGCLDCGYGIDGSASGPLNN
jgi:hypothetical protein